MGIFSKLMVPAAVAVALVASTFSAGAVPVSPTQTPTAAGNIIYDYGPLGGSDYTDIDVAGGGGINLQDAIDSILESVVAGTGSLTVRTYVDPFISTGVGGANVRLGIGGAVFPAGTVTVAWGGGSTVDLSDGAQKDLSVLFTAAGEAGAQDLVFTWIDASDIQISARLAAVPIPAAGFLLLGGLGGLVMVRRRRKAA